MKNLILALCMFFCGISFAATPPPACSLSGCTMRGAIGFNGGTYNATATYTNMFSDGTTSGIDFFDHTWTANQRRMLWQLSAGSFAATFVNDDTTAGANWLLVQGDGTGTTSIGLTGATVGITGGLTVTDGITATGTISGLNGTIQLLDTSGGMSDHPHIVQGTVALVGGNATVTLTGGAVYTGVSSYMCSTNDTGGSLVSSSQNINGTSFRVFGTGTDTIAFTCVGN